jgi:hypothetical protein
MSNHVKKTLRKSTVTNYEGTWNKYLSTYKNTPLKTMKSKAIYTMLDGAGESARMRKAIYTLLHSMLGKACIWGYVVENICDRVEPPKYKAKEKEIYTDEELTYIALNRCRGGFCALEMP